MKTTLLLALAASAMAQVYPSAVATDANLPRAVNSATTTLASSINNSTTTIPLTSGSRFSSNSVLTIGTERILCGALSTNTCTGATRGYDGSSAASHTVGSTVYGYFVAANINKALDEIKAIETFLGANGSGKLGSALKIFSAHDTGGDDTYVTTLPVSGSCPSALADLHVILTVDTANTGAATLDFCSLGALAIKAADGTSDPSNGDLAAGHSYLLQYVDAATDYWRMPSAGSGGSGALLSSNNLSDVASASTARTNLGLGIGVNVQAYDTDLAQLAALSCSDGQIAKKASGSWSCAADDTGGGGGSGDVVGPSSATDSCVPLYDGTTGKLLKDSTICADSTKNSGLSFQGVTSGELAFSVANIAGTATTLIWPADSNTATTGYALVLGGTTTCPTLIPAGLPSTCRSLSWSAVASSGGGTAVAPYSTTVTAQTSVSITASTHGQGTLAVPTCFDNSTPRLVIACSFTRNTSGDLAFTFSPAFTGMIQVGSGGGVSITPYSSSVSAQTSVSIAASSHGKGTTPQYQCLDNSGTPVQVACNATINGSGDLAFTFAPAFTGTILVRY